MNSISVRMQRIIRYKIFEKMTWEQVAKRLGRRATGEGVRKEYENFMKDKTKKLFYDVIKNYFN